MARILVIEDDTLGRRLAHSTLTRNNHEVVEAVNGAEGIELFSSAGPFDLVLTDIFMPEQDGLGVILALRKASKEVKIIAISGGGTRVQGDFLQQARALGANDVLSKPISPAGLREAIAQQLAAD